MTSSESPINGFDFEKHRRIAIERYQKLRPLYADFANIVQSILKEALTSSGIKVASIEARAKDVTSFANKASEPSPVDPSKPKYKDPLNEITDLAGVRVITFFPKTVDEVDRVINAEFVLHGKSDKGDILKEQDRFGYQSVHYLVKLKPTRTSLPEYARFNGLVAEIQVRTILQHAWAEIEHDIQYKLLQTIPSSIRRRFISLAGLLEIADHEFQAIQDEDERLKQAARSSVQEGKLEIVEITSDALKAYLNRKLGSDGRMTPFSYEWTARLLRKMGFENFQEIDECIKNYDDDLVSHIVWGSRQGQLSRFETQLLAGMGEHYISRHPWAGQEWFVNRRREELTRLRQAGIAIGNYRPTGLF